MSDQTVHNAGEEALDGKQANASIRRLTVPAIALSVNLSVAATHGRDPIQRAVLGVLRAEPTPLDAHRISEFLCLKGRERLVRSVLLALEDDGLVNEAEGLYAAHPETEEAGAAMTCGAYVFWDEMAGRFLPFAIRGVKKEWLDKASEASTSPDYTVHSQSGGRGELDKRELWQVAKRPDFTIFELVQSDGSVARSSDQAIRAIYSNDHEREFSLAVFAEIRPRLVGPPAVFFSGPVIEGVPFDPVYYPDFGLRLKRLDAQAYEALESEAARLTSLALRDLGAAVLDRLGPEEKIRDDARYSVECAIASEKPVPALRTDELLGSAVVAEFDYILLKSGVKTLESAARWGYFTVFQTLSRLLGDFAGEHLTSEPFSNSLKRMIKEQKQNRLSGSGKRVWAQEHVRHRHSETGIPLAAWDMSMHLKNLPGIRDAASDTSSRHQLGSSFVLWFMPLYLDCQSDKRRRYIQALKKTLINHPDVPRLYHAVKEIRNRNKTSLGATSDMTVLQIRDGVYEIWRAMESFIREFDPDTITDS